MQIRAYFLIAFLAFVFMAPAGAAAGEWDDAGWNSRSALEARRSATVSTETGGRILRIHREMGERFNAGDVLVELDDTLARSALESARAGQEASDSILAATKSMYEKRSASQVELAEAKFRSAEAAAKFKQAAHDRDACRIEAPFGGRIAEVLVNEHELVEKGAPVVIVMDDSSLVAKFLFPEEKFDEIAVGDVLDLEVPVAGLRIQARVSHIAPGMDPASRTFEIWALADNGSGALRAGMTAVLAGDSGNAVR